MSSKAAVLVTLIAYKVVLLAIGLLAERRTRDGVDFFLGGRRLGPLVAAISASASSSSAWTLLGVSGAAYGWGLSAIWLFPACVGGFVLNWWVLAPALREHGRRTEAVTVTDVIAGPAGQALRGAVVAVASAVVLVSLGSYVASQFAGAGKAIGKTFDIDSDPSVIAGAAIVIAYTLLGGFWAVSLTDTLQGLVMAGACVLLPLAALVDVGGPAALVESLRAVSEDGYLDWTRDAGLAGGIGFVLGTLGIGLGYPGQPHVVNRFLALRGGAAELRWARRASIAWAVTVYSGMLALGWCGRVLFPGLSDPETVLVEAANSLLHPVLAGILLAAVLSAVMSTTDSQLLVAASTITHDLGLGGRTQRHVLLRSRLTVLALGGAAVVAALWVREAIFHRVLFAWTAMGAAFGPLLLVTVLRGPVRPRFRIAAMALGFGLSAVFYALDGTRGGILERVAPFGVALAVCVWGASSRGLDPAGAGARS